MQSRSPSVTGNTLETFKNHFLLETCNLRFLKTGLEWVKSIARFFVKLICMAVSYLVQCRSSPRVVDGSRVHLDKSTRPVLFSAHSKEVHSVSRPNPTIHAELGLILRLLENDPHALHYVGLSKLSCSTFWMYIDALNIYNLPVFTTGGTHGKFYDSCPTDLRPHLGVRSNVVAFLQEMMNKDLASFKKGV